MAQVAIVGNTYPVKEALKSLGAHWNPDQKAWMIDAAKAEKARAIVAGAPRSTSTRPHSEKCHDCGQPSRGYYYCYDCSLQHRLGGSAHAGGQSYTYRDARGDLRFVLGDDD
jgi:hypothetical protein